MRKVIAAALIGWALPACSEAEWIGTYVWSSHLDYFGGFSGLEVSDDGARFMVISDAGYFGEGEIVRAEDEILEMTHAPFYLLPAPPVWPRTGDLSRDTEGLAVGPDGQVFVSFEGIALVRAEDGRYGTPRLLPRHPDFRQMQHNGSLEALAVDGAGRLYAIPERSGRAMRPFPVYRLEGGAWEVIFDLPRRGQFVPVGADVGPDGRLYVLERDFNGWTFSTRIRRFDLNGGNEETVLETRPGVHDNLEGIAVWQDAQGLRITMISDDNFRRRLQQTEVVEYRLTQ